MICEIQSLIIDVMQNYALMFIISNQQGINCLSSLLQVEPRNVMFKVISDIMAHWYDMWNKYNCYCNLFLQCKENDLCIDVYNKQSLSNKMS